MHLLELLAVQLRSIGMGEDHTVPNTEVGIIGYTLSDGIRTSEKIKYTYIHGSVEESPSVERERSLERPGANTPRPYPRIDIHQGSLNVSLSEKH